MSDISIGKVVVSPNKVNVKGTFKISVYIKEYRQDKSQIKHKGNRFITCNLCQ